MIQPQFKTRCVLVSTQDPIVSKSSYYLVSQYFFFSSLSYLCVLFNLPQVPVVSCLSTLPVLLLSSLRVTRLTVDRKGTKKRRKGEKNIYCCTSISLLKKKNNCGANNPLLRCQPNLPTHPSPHPAPSLVIRSHDFQMSVVTEKLRDAAL